MIVLNSNRCLNSTFGFGVLFVWSIIYTYTCISMISSKEAWKQVGKKYALVQPYCKTAWIYSPKIDFTSSSKNPKEITHKQSFDNGRLWNMNASYTIMSQHIFWCLSDLQFYSHSSNMVGAKPVLVPSSPYSIPQVQSFCS